MTRSRRTSENTPPQSKRLRIAPEQLNVLLAEQREAWGAGGDCPVEQLMDAVPALSDDDEALLDLICNEISLRSALGELPDVQEFIALRFPQFADDVQRLFEIQRAIDGDEDLLGVGGVGNTAQAESLWRRNSSTQIELRRPVSGNTPEISGYEILREAGRGGMGIVYVARHVMSQRLVALKMIRAGQFASTRDLDRFLREAELTAKLNHPHVVRMYDVQCDGDVRYISMEYVEGESLAQRLERGVLRPKEAADIMAAVADAASYAHQRGIIHRDLKPQNILLDHDGVPKIADFGLAKTHEGSACLSSSTHLLGTPQYFSPEQAALNHQEVGPATDIYNLGLILYQCLTGRVPFTSDSLVGLLHQIIHAAPTPPRVHVPSVPRDLETVCLRCLQKSPSARYRSAVELREDLQRFRHGIPVCARRVGFIEQSWSWAMRYPLLATSLSMIVLLLCLLSLTGIWGTIVLQEKNNEIRLALVEQAYVSANALRLSERAGRSDAVLQAIQQVVPHLGDEADEISWKTRLRREAVASLTQLDLREVSRLSIDDRATDSLHTVSTDDTTDLFAYANVHDDIVMLEARSGTRLVRIPCEYGTVYQVVLHSSGDYLAVVHDRPTSTDLTVYSVCRDLSMKENSWQCKPCAVVEGVARECRPGFAPKLPLIATSTADHELIVVGLPEGIVDNIASFDEPILGCKFSPSASELACWSSEGFRVVHPISGEELACIGDKPWTSVRDIAWSEAGEIAAGTEQHTILCTVFGGGSDSMHALFGHQGWVESVSFDPQGRFVISSSKDGTTRLWNSYTQELLLKADGCALGISADGQWVVGLAGQQFVRWKVVSPELSQPLRKEQFVAEGEAATFDSQGQFMATATWSDVILWNAPDQITAEVPVKHTPSLLKVTPDGSELVAVSTFDIIRWPILRDAQENAISLGTPETVDFPGCLDSESISLSTATDRVGFLWENDYQVWYRDGRRHILPLPELHSWSTITMHPQDDVVALATGDGVEFRSIETGEVMRRRTFDSCMRPVLFSPSGRYLVVDDHATSLLWDLATDQLRQITRPPHTRFLLGGNFFSQDDQLLVLIDGAASISVLAVETGNELLTIPVGVHNPYLAISSDNQQLVCTTRYTQFQWWDLAGLGRCLGDMGLGWQEKMPFIPEIQTQR